MSNKTQLQTNYTNLSNLIETLRGKASGGSGVETCTIQLICDNSYFYGYSYLAYRDNGFVPVTVMNQTLETLNISLTDVICGGYIYLQAGVYTEAVYVKSIVGNATYEKIEHYSSGLPVVIIYAPNEANSSSIITF